jgi:hypothetical protein
MVNSPDTSLTTCRLYSDLVSDTDTDLLVKIHASPGILGSYCVLNWMVWDEPKLSRETETIVYLAS